MEAWGGGVEGGVMLGVRRGGVHGQTGDAHLTMTGWVGSKEGKRGRVGGKGDGRRGVCVGGGQHGFVSAEDTQRREMGWLI